MAMGTIRVNDYFRAYYLKKRQEGMQHKKAIVALMNKLARVIYALLKKREKFNIEKNRRGESVNIKNYRAEAIVAAF